MNKFLFTQPIAEKIAVSLSPTTPNILWRKSLVLIAVFTLSLIIVCTNNVISQNLYWRTDGASQSWTGVNWSVTPTTVGGIGWTNGYNAIFTTNSSPIFVTNQQVGNITLSGTTTTVSLTKAGTFSTNGKIISIDVCGGCTFNWGSQLVSTTAGTGFKKVSAGTWNIGGSMNASGAPAGITINAGTVIVTSSNSLGGGPLTMNGGTLQSTGNAFNISQMNIGGSFIFSGTGADTYGYPIILSVTPTITNSTSSGAIRQLTGGISGNFGLNFNGAGAGVIAMGGVNTFTGPLTLASAEVCFANDASFGAVPSSITPASIIIDGGKMTAIGTDNSTTVNYTLDSKRGIQVGSSAASAINVNTGSTLTYNGVIANKPSANGTWTKLGSGTLILGGLCTYTGATTLKNGTLRLTSNALPTATILNIGQPTSTNLGLFDLNGNSQTIAGLASIVGNNVSASKNTVTSLTAATLTINSSTSNVFGAASTINSGIISGAISLVKDGSGTQTLGDINTYTGATSITAGTLLMASTGSLSASSAVTVSTNGILSGTGSALGSVDLFGTISPAATGTIGTLTTGNLTLEAGGFYHFDVNKTSGTPGTDWDNLVTGSLTNNTTVGSNFTVAINGTITGFVSANANSWVIGRYTGTAPSSANLVVNTTGITNSFTGKFTIGFSSNNINLNYSTCTLGTWQGGNTAWSTNSNWCSSFLPISSTNVTIPVSSFYPIISATSPVNNIVIASGASVNVAGILQVAGSISNAGLLDISKGALELNGTTAQSIQGTDFSGSTIGGLIINNLAGVTIGGQLNITDSIIPVSGILYSGGFITLKSSATKTARIATGTGTYLLGNVTAERFITAKAARKYSFIGSSVSQTFRNAWQQQIYITGIGSGGTPCGATAGSGGATDKYNSSGFDASQNNASTVLYYTANTIKGSHYAGLPNTSSLIVPGIGYCVNVRGDRNSSSVTCTNQLTSSSPIAPESVTLIATGSVTTGNILVTLNDTASHKLTLLANPYPSQISFSAFKSSNTIINNKMWMFSPFGTGNFATYANGHITNGAVGYDDVLGDNIAIGQAFFVEANANGSVSFAEEHKTNGSIPNSQYFGTADKSVRIGLFNTDNIRLDEILLLYTKAGSTNYNEKLDATSMSLTSQALVLYKGNDKLAIAEVQDYPSPIKTQLGVSIKTGLYHLAFSQLESIDVARTITLVDKFLGIASNVRNNPNYRFTVTSDTASKGGNRFILLLGSAQSLPVNVSSISVVLNPTNVIVIWQVVNEANIISYELQRSVNGVSFTSINSCMAKGANSYSLTDNSLPLGAAVIYYRLKIKAENGMIEYTKVVAQQLNEERNVAISPNPVHAELFAKLNNTLNGNQVKVKISTMAGNDIYNLGNVSILNNTFKINVSALAVGVYLLELTDCSGNKFINMFIKE